MNAEKGKEYNEINKEEGIKELPNEVKTHEVKTHEIKTHEVKTHEVKTHELVKEITHEVVKEKTNEVIIEKQIGLSADEIENITKDMKQKQKQMEEMSKIQLLKFEENVIIMKKELEDYKQQNKVLFSDLQRNVNDKCALSQLEEVHNQLLNELKRHEIKTYSKLQEIDIEGSKNVQMSANNGVSKEFIDQIMKKIDDIKSSKF